MSLGTLMLRLHAGMPLLPPWIALALLLLTSCVTSQNASPSFESLSRRTGPTNDGWESALRALAGHSVESSRGVAQHMQSNAGDLSAILPPELVANIRTSGLTRQAYQHLPHASHNAEATPDIYTGGLPLRSDGSRLGSRLPSIDAETPYDHDAASTRSREQAGYSHALNDPNHVPGRHVRHQILTDLQSASSGKPGPKSGSMYIKHRLGPFSSLADVDALPLDSPKAKRGYGQLRAEPEELVSAESPPARHLEAAAKMEQCPGGVKICHESRHRHLEALSEAADHHKRTFMPNMAFFTPRQGFGRTRTEPVLHTWGVAYDKDSRKIPGGGITSTGKEYGVTMMYMKPGSRLYDKMDQVAHAETPGPNARIRTSVVPALSRAELAKLARSARRRLRAGTGGGPQYASSRQRQLMAQLDPQGKEAKPDASGGHASSSSGKYHFRWI
ncbi:hypothetical protein IE81DRAFT_157259 [Ceraceosorus guamensis]|uniref:SCP domain-containing protein n=1 Tax=Ceraceosorus guamensis TaxID=1522189 RepID=A0A316VW99_9BASI|nr:hypothetical protein IE81DRAFT_157259 [Ceraceosorus guamensis]PWN41722.1 hypothetical protein IE81DRAFT_157259 [Ceraceosorus guamensis]